MADVKEESTEKHDEKISKYAGNQKGHRQIRKCS